MPVQRWPPARALLLRILSQGWPAQEAVRAFRRCRTGLDDLLSLSRASEEASGRPKGIHRDEPRVEEHQKDVRTIRVADAVTEVDVSSSLTKPNEIEAITALAAKSFARVLSTEQRERPRGSLRRYRFESRSEALSAAPEDLSWSIMGELEDSEPGSFAILWERMKEVARDELESGQRAAAVACGQDSPLNRARFLVLREKYIDEWQPRNVLESQLIDAICQAQTIREYWMKLATERVATECMVERFTIELHGKRREHIIDGTESAREAREEAERWDRVFLRSIRALRDLRRYAAAVIVNNQGGQVNVATDQSQQTNAVKRIEKKKR